MLVIDDDTVEAEILGAMFTDEGRFEADIVHAADSKAARAALGKRDFDVIFLDYMLGTEDGLKVFKSIRATGTQCPVIFMTGQGSEALAASAKRAGLAEYLPKDELSPEAVGRAVDRALDSWEAERTRTSYEHMLNHLATVDDLTGLLNRRAFVPLLIQECARTTRYGRPLALMCADIDEFDELVEAHGRVAAEEVLASFSVLLRGILRTTDHYCRYEGNRFCVILTETDRALAVGAAERLISYCRTHAVEVAGVGPMQIRPSVAVTPILPEHANADAVLLETFNALGASNAQSADPFVLVDL